VFYMHGAFSGLLCAAILSVSCDSGQPGVSAITRSAAAARLKVIVDSGIATKKAAPDGDKEFAREFRRQLNRRLSPGLDEAAVRDSPFLNDEEYTKNLRFVIERALTIQPYIVGGEATSDFPDCVAVGSEPDENGVVDWGCTGVLVATNVVVTAGHCKDDGFVSRVFIGPDVHKPGDTILVKTAVQHPQYHGDPAYDNDLTVLILENDATTATPRAFADKADIDSARFVHIVGYGFKDRWRAGGKGDKQQVDVFKASSSCGRPDDVNTYGCHAKLELVAADKEAKKDSCFGDSGGPAYVTGGFDNAWYVGAFTSRPTRNSVEACGEGGIYVRADEYEVWIRSVPGGHWPP
jgi:secreted trypsin-like serine protease